MFRENYGDRFSLAPVANGVTCGWWRALFDFLLGVQVTAVATLLVASMRVQADHLVAVRLLGELMVRRLNNLSADKVPSAGGLRKTGMRVGERQPLILAPAPQLQGRALQYSINQSFSSVMGLPCQKPSCVLRVDGHSSPACPTEPPSPYFTLSSYT